MDKLNQVAMKIQFQQDFKICMDQKVIENKAGKHSTFSIPKISS